MNNGLSPQLLQSIAKEFGTPVYVYDLEKITRQYHRLIQAFEGLPVRIFYASKALTNIHILKHIYSLGSSVDCSSINEVILARYAGIPADHILYTSNSISFDEIMEAQKEGVRINIDSLSNLAKFGKKFGNSYPVGIRLRPNVMAGGNLKISTGHDKSKFGIPVDQLEDILKVVATYELRVEDLHVHTGSEISDVTQFMKSVHILMNLAVHFPHLRVLDLGGGFKVPYKDGDEYTDMDLLRREIEKSLSELKANTGRDHEIWFEPGKFMVSEAGYLIASVNVLKETPTVTFAGLNTGFNHLIRPMFYGSYHQIENLSNPEGTKKNYAIVGNICETDTFAWDREVAEIREDDFLVFMNAGAYGFEMASNFNSRFRPAEVMVKDGKPILIRKRETIDDLLRNQLV